MKKILMLLMLSICLAGCSSDDDNQEETTNSFAGSWAGTYTGGDEGTWNIVIDMQGNATGTAYSTMNNISFNINGAVSSTGDLIATIGNTSIGSAFTGQLNDNYGNGDWVNTFTDPDLTGTWMGSKQ